jgi:hypothetical protein
MMKLLVLQQWYGLSDPELELERQVTDRISFRRFLGFLDVIPYLLNILGFLKSKHNSSSYPIPIIGLYYRLSIKE